MRCPSFCKRCVQDLCCFSLVCALTALLLPLLRGIPHILWCCLQMIGGDIDRRRRICLSDHSFFITSHADPLFSSLVRTDLSYDQRMRSKHRHMVSKLNRSSSWLACCPLISTPPPDMGSLRAFRLLGFFYLSFTLDNQPWMRGVIICTVSLMGWGWGE